MQYYVQLTLSSQHCQHYSSAILHFGYWDEVRQTQDFDVASRTLLGQRVRGLFLYVITWLIGVLCIRVCACPYDLAFMILLLSDAVAMMAEV